MSLENGSIINQYKIISAIGKGGMGEVFLAQDKKLERRVALKILPAEFAADLDRMNRFVREAKSASALNHPNIITIHEIGEAGGTHYIATEFIDGKTLGDYAKAETLDCRAILEIAVQVVSALQIAHSNGIVHRDIKPDNIMVRADGLAKILDFGIAKLAAPTESNEEAATAIQSQTQAGMIIGTPNYMSPEQARGQVVNHQTDIFSFGVVLYEMLSGASPFAGDTVGDVIAAVLTKEPPRLTNVSPELGEILDKTLQKDKRNRYKSAKDLLDDLKEALEELAMNSRLNRVSSPNAEEPQKQILQAATTGEENRQITSENLKSIAVLPFANMSADEENEYFCDGLAEELLNALSKIEDLKVAARTSVFSFKGRNADASEIGEKLGVKNVLEGSVRRSGNKLRISVQLVNAANGFQLWSERYDREMKDIFDIQDEIALAVVDALKVKLFGDEKATVLNHYTDNTEAYQLYLKGRYHANKFTRESFDKALEYFNQAISLDPNFALAYTGMANAYYHAATFQLPPKETLLYMKEAAVKALELDDSVAEAHTFLALFKTNYERQPLEAEAGFRRGVELSPNNVVTRENYGIYLMFMKRADEAISELRLAQNLDPLSPFVNFVLSYVYYISRQPEKTLAEARKSLETEPNFWMTHWIMALGYEQTGQYSEALSSIEKARASDTSPWIPPVMARIYAKLGQQEKARKILDELTEKSNQQWIAPCLTATAYLYLDEREQAFEWLNEAFDEYDEFLQCLTVDPAFDSIHSDSRFQTLVQRMGFAADKRNITDESLEAGTVMLRTGEATSDSAAKDLTTEKAETKPPTQPATDAKPEAQKAKSKWWLFGLLGLLALVGGLFGYKYLAPTNKQIESIAVMPFVNESGNADTEYLSDGMTETLINNLSQIPNLSVKARSSVFRYKGKELDPKKIAAELNVQAILTGRVIQRGEQVTLNLELIDANTENTIWGNKYERKSSDLVSLQSEIAHDVSGKLKSKLSDADEQKIAKNYTANPQAYQLYLKGKFSWNKRTGEALKQAAEFYRQAIELDPNYALAYSGLAETYVLFSSYDVASATDSMPQAKAAALRALEIDEQLAEAHTALGFYFTIYEWDRVRAANEHRRAIEIKPDYATAHHWLGMDMAIVKRFDDSFAELRRAEELDPLSPIIGTNIGDALVYARRYDEAIAQFKRVLIRNPNFDYARQSLGWAYGLKGMYAEAISETRAALELNDNSNSKGYLALWLAKSGKRDEALKLLGELKLAANNDYVQDWAFAIAYIGLGDKEEALNWLEKGMNNHSEYASYYAVSPELDELRSEPRFKAMLKRMNLPE